MAKILIIDDSEVIRTLLTDYLSDLGHEISQACDGQEGIDMALTGEYDIIFCDIHMPRKNGYEVFKVVSAAKPNVHFIMTDSLPGELAEMALEAGAHHCLTKPFDLEQINKALNVFENERQRT